MTAPVDAQFREKYPWLGSFTTEPAHAFVHDVIAVSTDDRRYALKLYRSGVRTEQDIQWEVALSSHLLTSGAPVARLVQGVDGLVERLEVDGVDRFAVMSEWAPGSKPSQGDGVYRMLGRAAASIHAAADTFETKEDPPVGESASGDQRSVDPGTGGFRAPLDVTTLLDTQLALLEPALVECGRWSDVANLTGALRGFIDTNKLEWGICHNDLTLDNVHVDGDVLTVFDFDSASPTWRALEPALVYDGCAIDKQRYWQAWLDGYREVRNISDADMRAFPMFSIMYQFSNIAWKLGLTPTSVGQLMTPEELPDVVDKWLGLYEMAADSRAPDISK